MLKNHGTCFIEDKPAPVELASVQLPFPNRYLPYNNQAITRKNRKI